MQWLVAGAQPHDALFFLCKPFVSCDTCFTELPCRFRTWRPDARCKWRRNRRLWRRSGEAWINWLTMTDRSWSIVIFPVDVQRKGHIVDDVCDLPNVVLFLIHFFNLQELHGTLVKNLPTACRLTVRIIYLIFHAWLTKSTSIRQYSM